MSKEREPPLKPPERNVVLPMTLTLAPCIPGETSDLQNYKVVHLCCFKPLRFGQLFAVATENEYGAQSRPASFPLFLLSSPILPSSLLSFLFESARLKEQNVFLFRVILLSDVRPPVLSAYGLPDLSPSQPRPHALLVSLCEPYPNIATFFILGKSLGAKGHQHGRKWWLETWMASTIVILVFPCPTTQGVNTPTSPQVYQVVSSFTAFYRLPPDFLQRTENGPSHSKLW